MDEGIAVRLNQLLYTIAIFFIAVLIVYYYDCTYAKEVYGSLLKC